MLSRVLCNTVVLSRVLFSIVMFSTVLYNTVMLSRVLCNTLVLSRVLCNTVMVSRVLCNTVMLCRVLCNTRGRLVTPQSVSARETQARNQCSYTVQCNALDFAAMQYNPLYYSLVQCFAVQ